MRKLFLAAVVIALAGVFLCLSGVFPCSSGCWFSLEQNQLAVYRYSYASKGSYTGSGIASSSESETRGTLQVVVLSTGVDGFMLGVTASDIAIESGGSITNVPIPFSAVVDYDSYGRIREFQLNEAVPAPLNEHLETLLRQLQIVRDEKAMEFDTTIRDSVGVANVHMLYQPDNRSVTRTKLAYKELQGAGFGSQDNASIERSDFFGLLADDHIWFVSVNGQEAITIRKNSGDSIKLSAEYSLEFKERKFLSIPVSAEGILNSNSDRWQEYAKFLKQAVTEVEPSSQTAD